MTRFKRTGVGALGSRSANSSRSSIAASIQSGLKNS